MGAEEILVAERAALCDSFERYGPDAPTLCEGWTAADLASHLVVRERRPDAMPGIVLPGPFAAHTARLMDGEQAKGFDSMVATLRAGPPLLFRKGPGAAPNVVENWIHHEDLRRAQTESPRPRDPDLDAILWRSLALSIRLAALRARGITIELRSDLGNRRAGKGPTVVIEGPPGEIVLFLTGRKDAAQVELSGPDDAVARVRAARLGL